MEIIRSNRLISRNDNDFLTNIYNFLKANGSWYATDDTNKILYVTSNIYIAPVQNSSAFALDLMDNTSGANWGNVRTAYMSTDSYFNVVIYKVNSDCFGIAFNSGDTNITYSNVCSVIIDSYTVGGTKHKMAVGCNNYTRFIADGKTPNTAIYTTYTTDTNRLSVSESYPTGQIARFVSPYGGQAADNLYTILLTNQTDKIVTLNETEKWLFTNGFALPCGSSITESYYSS